MKQYWYLIATLPGLHLGEKPLISSAAFLSLCADQLTPDELSGVTAILPLREPPAGIASNLWNNEIQLRNAIVRVRAKNSSLDATPFLQTHSGYHVSMEKMVTDAFTRPNPMEQQMELDRVRWSMADELAGTDSFGVVSILAYAVKLRIAEYWATLDDEKGRQHVEELITASLETIKNR
ncbi:MAG: DUF2764 family protein [Kiritimatiellaceae bacterium]|nr:DUF2764 family protein [Kiritimatiellaceae bacterium]